MNVVSSRKSILPCLISALILILIPRVGLSQTQLALTNAPALPIAGVPAAPPSIPDAPSPQLIERGELQTQTSSQTSTQTSSQTSTQTSTQPLSKEQQAQRDVKAEEKQRIMGIMPAFNTTTNQSAVPLSRGQKMNLAFHSAVDPWQFGLALVDGGIGMAEDTNKGYGEGAPGYFKRFGASYADAFDGAIIGNGILPALWHQDPRYFQMGQSTNGVHNKFSRRFWHAAASTIICRGDSGHTQFNFSNVVGNFIAGGISNIYYPSEDRGVSQTISAALTVTAEGAIGAELLEFWPDIQHKLFKHRFKDPYAAAPDAAAQDAPPATPKQQTQPEPK